MPLLPPVQPSSWGIKVSEEDGSIVFVDLDDEPEPEEPPENYIFFPKYVSSDAEFIFLKAPRVVDVEQEIFENFQYDSPPRSNGQPNNVQTQEMHENENESEATNEITIQQNDEEDFVVLVDPSICSTFREPQKTKVTNLIQDAPGFDKKQQAEEKQKVSNNGTNKSVLTTMIEVSNDISSDDQEDEDEEMQGNLKPTATKTKQKNQRRADDFLDEVNEAISNIPPKKFKTRSHYQKKLIHPESARPGREWSQQLSNRNTFKKFNAHSSNNLPPRVSKGIERKKSVSLQNNNQQASCGMEFLIKKVPKEFNTSSSHIQDEQRRADIYQQAEPAPVHMNDQFSHDHGNEQFAQNAPSRNTSAQTPGRAYRWVDDTQYSFQEQNQPNYSANNVNTFRGCNNSQVQGHQAFYQINRSLNPPVCTRTAGGAYDNWATAINIQQPSNGPYNGHYWAHQSNCYQGNHFIHNNHMHPRNAPVPATPSYGSYSNTGSFNVPQAPQYTHRSFPQNKKFITSKHNNHQRQKSVETESMVEITDTFDFYRNGEEQECDIICDGELTHAFRNLDDFSNKCIISFVHLKTRFQEEPEDIFSSPEWTKSGLFIASLIERSKVNEKITRCPYNELTLTYLKPSSTSEEPSEVNESHKRYTKMFSYLASRQRVGVFSCEKELNVNGQKQTAYLYPLSKKEELVGALEIYFKDDVNTFPSANHRPDLLLTVILSESAY